MTSPIRVALVPTAFLLAVFASSAPARAQNAPSSAPAERAEVDLDYNYAHSNAPPGGCGCFNLNGAGGDFAWFLLPEHFAIVGDLSVTHASTVSTSADDLTLTAVTFGGRYRLQLGASRLHPYGQALAGFAHASGSLAQGANPAAANAGAAFAANLGGGVDWDLGRRYSIRIIDADYFATRFDNGSNDHQNNLRLGAGLAFHF